MGNRLEKCVFAGTDKKLLAECLAFMLPKVTFHGAAGINGFHIDTQKGWLCFCSYNTKDPERVPSIAHLYPMRMSCDMFAEQIMNWLEDLSEEELVSMGCDLSDNCWEDPEIGWCVFIPDWYSHEYGVTSYHSCGIQHLCVKPIVVDTGK